MIDFNDVLANPDKYESKPISSIKQELKVGDRVRCYEQDSTDMNHFIGYATITELLNEPNTAWCEDDKNNINYAYWVVLCK